MVKEFRLNRNMVGIAGLKDKNAITRQWLSISKKDVIKSCGGINTLLAWLRTKGKVITATYGDHMLKVGENKGNHFDIVLVPNADSVDKKSATKNKKPVRQTDAQRLFSHWDRNNPETIVFKEYVTSILATIEKRGLPNYFGEQRFGRFGGNRQVGFDLLSGTIRNIK